METTRCFFVFITVVWTLEAVELDTKYMTSRSETLTIPSDFETELVCEMNMEPDKFEWKFYPSNEPYNPKVNIDLSNATFTLLSLRKSDHHLDRRRSNLKLQVKDSDTGDYQCLAYYGAFVVASVPWRITLATLKPFPYQSNATITAISGSTVSWRCEKPESNPEAYVEYYKNGEYITSSSSQPSTNTLTLVNVNHKDSGSYTCSATNTIQNVRGETTFRLNVVDNAPAKAPYFIITPKKTYTVTKGSTVLLECSAIGNPVPKVVWFKKNSQLPSDRIEMDSKGLKIKNITSKDDGVYTCNHTNTHGIISHNIMLIYNEMPSIDCVTNSVEVKQKQNLDLECTVEGTPEPQIAWFLNGFSVTNDSSIEAIGNKIYFRPTEKRHAGNLQIFARNVVGTVYNSISITVVPLTTSIDVAVTPSSRQRHHKKRPQKPNKPPKMVPPDQPTISRLNDESVVVRWNVPPNDGLPIQFFKVQYKEVEPNVNDHRGRSKGWKTTNADIPPNIKDYDVMNLKPDHYYRFRIAAVYSNNDNKLSPVSNRFHLKRLDFEDRNPLPIPIITRAETVSDKAVKIYWECPKQSNVTVKGYYISYMPATTAGDYMKATAEGENTTTYVITHLQSDTFYDIKLQSFNSKSASDFSSIMKAKTAINPTSQLTTTSPPPVVATPKTEATGINRTVIIGSCALIFAFVGSLVVVFCLCRKWKQKVKQDLSKRDKSAVEEHHIQVDGNDYPNGQKSVSRSNGCALPGNRITITANPLAEADNKNPSVIELRNLTSQNNNVGQNNLSPSPSNEESHANSKEKHNRSDKYKRSKMVDGAVAPPANYV